MGVEYAASIVSTDSTFYDRPVVTVAAPVLELPEDYAPQPVAEPTRWSPTEADGTTYHATMSWFRDTYGHELGE